MATHSIILAGKSHGQRSLLAYSPWGYRELDMTERINKEEMGENSGGPEGEFDLKMSTGSLLLPATCLQPQVEVEFCL